LPAHDSYAYRRAQMLESLKRGGITDQRVMEAMAEIPRHYFVPEAFRHQAYDDDVSIHIGEGQTISQPRIVALMTESARIDPQDRVLEVGTGKRRGAGCQRPAGHHQQLVVTHGESSGGHDTGFDHRPSLILQNF